MTQYVVRVRLPDRPGALGAVASRIGAVRADVVSIEILERHGPTALDELTIDLEDVALLNLLVQEIEQVDGVHVVHIRPAVREVRDVSVAAVGLAGALVKSVDQAERNRVLVEGVRDVFGADWVVLVPTSRAHIVAIASSDEAPSEEWFRTYLIGTNPDERPFAAVDELESVPVGSLDFELVLSRKGANLVQRELDMIAQITSIFETTSDPL